GYVCFRFFVSLETRAVNGQGLFYVYCVKRAFAQGYHVTIGCSGISLLEACAAFVYTHFFPMLKDGTDFICALRPSHHCAAERDD
ncbi:MAG: hypothetical protein J5510_05000, partial [Prevotella sp.]|nr:hypothetical protein [Prevotella sp.]